MADLIPHLRVPFDVERNQVALVGQDSLDEITQNVATIVQTRVGERLASPDFGLADPTFRTADSVPDEAEIRAAVDKWEPRALLTFTDKDQGPETRAVLEVAKQVAA